MTTIQNEASTVENQALVEKVLNEVVANATNDVFCNLLALDNMKNLAENISVEIISDLAGAGILSEQLELTERQKERLELNIYTLVERAKNNYVAKIKSDERTTEIAKLVSVNLTTILEQLLAGLGKEVNRGAIINCTAVEANTKNEKYNKIELNCSKFAGDITIPTRCLLLSTNCYDIIAKTVFEEMKPFSKMEAYEN